LVSAVDSSVSGLAGLGPTGPGARAPVSPADGAKGSPNFAQTGVGGDAATTPDNANGANLAGPVNGAFAAQAFAQESGASVTGSFAPRSPKQAAAAYQATETQTDPKSTSDVQLPGLPARLASGRTLDFRA
jgi:hypothetical protein